jgi:tetratricopeptide (TPR) repeat protein
MFELFSEKGRRIRDARKLRRQGDYQRSGELFELVEHYDEALEMYQKARSHLPAARLCEKLGRIKEAALFYEHAGQYEAAGALFSRLGDSIRAAQTFQRAGLYFKAGVIYQQLRIFREAAQCFEKAGQEARAAECYLAGGAVAQAARMYKTLLEKVHPPGEPVPMDPDPELRALALQAAECFERAKEIADAAEAWRLAGELIRSAEAYLRVQRPREAAEMYFQGQAYEKGMMLVRNHGLAVFDANVLAEALRRAGRHAEAGELFETSEMWIAAADEYGAAGQSQRAAEIYERVHEHASAAVLYRAAGLHDRAAESFLRAEQPRSAVEDFLMAGDKLRAAETLASLGERLEAARLLLELGRSEEALSELQKLPPESPSFLEASDQIGQIFIGKDLLPLAVERYRMALAGRPLNDQTRPLYFNLATALERAGKEPAALTIYQKIATADFSYRGVGQRVEQLRAHMRSTTQDRSAAQDSKSIKLLPTRQNMEPKELFGGRYEILSRLGDGGMGSVYKARDLELDEIIALKVLRRAEPTTVERLKRELKVARKLSHPNIVRLFHFSEAESVYFLCMEYVDGRTLKSLVIEQGAFPTVEAIPILTQIARALQAAHAAGVIHRDIKPQNILLDARHQVKVLDFGIAWSAEESVSLTMEGEVVGTPEYMSPEQISAKPVDARSDLYSLGVVAYELITGQVPFRGETPVATVLQHLREEPVRPCVVHPLVPTDIEKIVLRLLRKNPKDRYKSAHELLADLAYSDS